LYVTVFIISQNTQMSNCAFQLLESYFLPVLTPVTLDRLMTFLVAFSTLVLNLPLKVFLVSHLSLAQACLQKYDHSVFGSHWR